jgi:CRISPR system Cascade subunit CasD
LVLGKKQLGTILSSREYRSDALALVAIRALESAPYSLVKIKEHLLSPKFHLYLGRKSCPLAVPLAPQIIEQENYFSVFKAYHHKPMLPTDQKNEGSFSKRDSDWLGILKDRYYYWEGDAADFSEPRYLNNMQTRTRHDQPLSRKRWQFSQRQENYLFIQGGE